MIEPSSDAWTLARERTKDRAEGGDSPDAPIEWVPLDRPQRTDVLARWVQAELDLGTAPRVVREVLAEHAAFGPNTIRYSVARRLTEEANRRDLDDRLAATREKPVDRGDLYEITALIDSGPGGAREALAWLAGGTARVTPEERRVLEDDARAMLAARAS